MWGSPVSEKVWFWPRQWLFWQFSSKAAVARSSLRFDFQLPHSNPILENNILQNDSKQTSCSNKIVDPSTPRR